ncbi:hypothetical protein P691DRAFT_785303, partial [Macrolepiota fuliginosa MF-IS2]
MSVSSFTAPAVPSNSDYDLGIPNVNLVYGVLSIGGSFAYVMFGVSCSQMTWYFRSYPRDPLAFKTFIGLVWIVDAMTFVMTICALYYFLIQRGIGTDPHNFIWCTQWQVLVPDWISISLNNWHRKYALVLVFTVFVERKRLAIFVVRNFSNHLQSPAQLKHGISVFVIRSVSPVIARLIGRAYAHYSSIRVPCYPALVSARIWLLSAYSLKILSDGTISGIMIWSLYHKSRGVRKQGGTIRVIRALIYWT